MTDFFGDSLNLQLLEDKCKGCKLHDKCSRKRKIGNNNNPKLVFILPEIETNDELNFDNPEQVRIGTVANIWRSISPIFKNSTITPNDILFLFVIPHKIEFPNNKIPKHKKDAYKHSIAEQCKEHLFYELYQLPEDAILIPVGSLPTQILLNAKNVFNLSGKEKERKITNPLNKKESKKFKVIPLIHPNSIQLSLKNRQVYIKSLNYIFYLLSGKKQNELKYKIITPDKVKSFVDKVLEISPPYVIFDTETSALIHKDRKIIGVSLKFPNIKTSYYIPLHSNNFINPETNEEIVITEYEKAKIKEQIKRLLTTIPFIGHNIKFDIVACQLEGILSEDNYTLLADTYVMAHIKYNQSLGGLGLKHLARLFFDVYDDWDTPLEIEKQKIAKIKKIPKRNVSYADIQTNLLGRYACYDVYYTELLYNKLNQELTPEEHQLHKQILNEIKAVATWEYYGVRIDKENFEKLKQYTIDKHSKAKFLMQNLPEIKKHFEDKFNPNSTKQLQKVIEIYNLPVLAKTDTGQPKFDKNVVEQYLKLDNISEEAKTFIQAYAEYKYYEKAVSSYINPIPEQTDNNGIFRTDFKICGTRSGRLSSYFHLLPSRTEYGKNFKRLISPKKEENIIISADLCLTPDTLVYTDKGWKKLIDVEPNKDKVLNDRGEWLDVYCIVDRGYGDVYEIETEKGFKIKCTLNHKFMCIDNNGKYRLATIRDVIDNKFYLAIKTIENENFKRDWLYVLLGIFLGDGSVKSRNSFAIYHSHKTKIDFTKFVLNQLGIIFSVKKVKGKNCYVVKFNSSEFSNLLHQLKLIEKANSRYKRKCFNEVLYSLDRDKRLSILLGFMNTDVYCDVKYNRFQLSNVVYDLMRFFHLTLLDVGIVGYFYPVKGKVFNLPNRQQCYNISISGYSYERLWRVFPELIRIFNPPKISKFQDNTWGLPNQKKIIPTTSGKWRVLKNTYTRGDIISKYKIEEIYEQDKNLYEFINETIKIELIKEYGLIFDKVKSVKFLGRQKVYDLSVSGNHIFVANGFPLSNSQAEPRTMASLSGDKKLQEVYNQGKDIYKYIASIVYHMDYDKVPKDTRNKMKSLVLALMYGMSPKTFAEKSGITVEEAEQIFDRFFTEFKDVYNFIQQRHKEVMRKGGITTPFDRFIIIDDREIYEKKKKAQNYIIQSTASELCLFQFSDITQHLIKSNMKSRVVASVHDSIVIDTYIPEIFQVINIMRFKLEKIIQLKYKFIRVPFRIDIQLGVSWGNSLEISNTIPNGYEIVGYKEDLEKLMDKLSKYDWKYEIIEEHEVEIPENSLISVPIEGTYKIYK